jgi:phage terminase large subunit
MSQTLEIKIPYVPNPKQAQFHKLAAKYRGFCGGWGNGKTSGGCAEFFIRLMEFPGTNSIIARKTRPELRTTTWDMFINGDTQPTGWQGIPKELIKINNKSDLYLELMNGSRVHGLPLDDPKKLENYNLGLFMVDQAEEVEEEILLKVQGRLRQHGAPREGIFLFNPNGHNYLWHRFINPKREQKFRRLYKAIEATPFDNPNLPEDYIEQFDALPKHWYDRYVLGSHDVFVGQIFVDFDPEVHIIEPFHIPSQWERWCSIDPGIGHEGAVSWVARDWDNNVFYYREIVEKGQPVDWWAEQIEDAESRRDYGGPDEEMFCRLIGPEANQRSQQDGRTVKGVYEEEGIDDLEIADRDPIARINRITSRLRPKPGHLHPLGGMDETDVSLEVSDSGSPAGAPTLYVFSTCTYTCEHLPQYRWRPVRASYSEETAPEKPRKKDDHTVDNLGHILVAMGDSEPEVPPNSRLLPAEERLLEEHFEAELGRATERSAAQGYVPGRIPTTVG